MRNLDMKNYRAPESAHMTRVVTYLIVVAIVAILSWMTERDGHKFNSVVAEAGNHEYCQ